MQDWIKEDQYAHGEWGENKNPTDEPRTMEISRLKPNQWCVAKAREIFERGQIHIALSPVMKHEAWLTVLKLIMDYKHYVELERGWELLWSDKDTPNNENAAQIAFWVSAKSIAKEKGCFIRESETGRGPVDFEFSNGINSRIQLEFKLASNPKLMNGLDKQLLEYMKAQEIDSGIFVVIGHNPKDHEKFQNVKERLDELMNQGADHYLEAVFIDASRKVSASKL